MAHDVIAKLGMLIEAGEHRDAIHIAIAPVIAAERLAPGDHIGFTCSDAETVGIVPNKIGIVDPFLKTTVHSGERFWMFLYPATITSLRHDWTHPAFSASVAPQAKSVSEQWLRDYAGNLDLTYTRLLDGAKEYAESMRAGGYGEYISDGGRYEGERVPDEFWEHYEAVTGDKVAQAHRGTFFSCSC